MTYERTRRIYIPADAVELKDTESSAVAYLYESAARGGRPAAVMFAGRRGKPDNHYLYQTNERRAEKVQAFFEAVRRSEAYRAERREANTANRRKAATLDFADKDYLSAADCAALLRRALAESFPGVRFSVRSDHGSLQVSWTDGPAVKTVEAIADQFEGSYFCGMEDYKGSNHHLLDGRRVRFGADFASCSRTVSLDHLKAGLAAFGAAHPHDVGALWIDESRTWGRVQCHEGAACIVRTVYHDVAIFAPLGGESVALPLEAALTAWADHASPVACQPSPTLARVHLLGTDGYGRSGAGAAPGCEGQSADDARAQMRERAAQKARDAESAELDAVAARFGVTLSTVN